MVLFFDTSALIKRYIYEDGTDSVEKFLDRAKKVIVSAFTKLEAYSASRRLLQEKRYSKAKYKIVLNEIELDFNFYTVVVYDEEIEENAKILIDKYQLKTLDALQLASCQRHTAIIESFISCDEKLLKAANEEGLAVINPLEISSKL